MGFKHTGLFPEQAANWDWMRNKIQSEYLSINKFYDNQCRGRSPRRPEQT